MQEHLIVEETVATRHLTETEAWRATYFLEPGSVNFNPDGIYPLLRSFDETDLSAYVGKVTNLHRTGKDGVFIDGDVEIFDRFEKEIDLKNYDITFYAVELKESDRNADKRRHILSCRVRAFALVPIPVHPH